MIQNPIPDPGRFALRTFSTNCSSGMPPTKIPGRWNNSWDNNLKLAKMLDAAGIDFCYPSPARSATVARPTSTAACLRG